MTAQLLFGTHATVVGNVVGDMTAFDMRTAYVLTETAVAPTFDD